MKMSAEEKFERDELKKLDRIEKASPREILLGSLVDEACDAGEVLAHDFHALTTAHADLVDKLRALVKEYADQANWEGRESGDSTRDYLRGLHDGREAAYNRCARELSVLIEGAK